MCNNKIWFVSLTHIIENASKLVKREIALPTNRISQIEKINDKTFVFTHDNIVGMEVDEDYNELVTRLNNYNNY